MRRAMTLMALLLTVAGTISAQVQKRSQDFASDSVTIPVVANAPGIGGTFQSYVSIYNPTSSAYSITATFYDGNGTPTVKTIALAAGELKTYTNFVDTVFTKTGGGAVTLVSPDSAGGQRNNRFIVNSEVRTGGTRYGTPIPALEFAGSDSRSFAPGVSNDANSRTNVGCFNQSASFNTITVTLYDANKANVGTQTLNLPPNGWGQTNLNSIFTGGVVQFDPSASAVCYAVVVDNTNNDGRFVSAVEYKP